MKSGRYRRQNWNQKIRGESCGCFCFVFGTYLLYSSKSWALSLYCDDPSPRRWSARSLTSFMRLFLFISPLISASVRSSAALMRLSSKESQWAIRQIREQKQTATIDLPHDSFEGLTLTAKCSSSIAAMNSIKALSRGLHLSWRRPSFFKVPSYLFILWGFRLKFMWSIEWKSSGSLSACFLCGVRIAP